LVTDEPDPATALREVGEPGRLLAAAVNPDVAVTVLRSISSLAWRTDDAAAILARVERWPSTAAVKRALGQTQLVIEAAREYRHVYSPVLPPYLYEMVAVAPYGSLEQRVHIGAALRRELRDDPAGYLASLETLVARCHDFAQALTVVLVDDVAPARRELATLPPEIAQDLDQRLTKLRGGVMSSLVSAGAVTTFLGVSIAGGVLVEPTFGMFAGGGSAFLVGRMRNRVYGRWVRGPLAGVLAEVGVTRAAARERMRQRGGRLARFALTAGDDHALRLFGMISAAATTSASRGA
jgi:hypothetical protein